MTKGSPIGEQDRDLVPERKKQRRLKLATEGTAVLAERKQTSGKRGPIIRRAINRISFLSLFKRKLLWGTSLAICQRVQESSGGILPDATSTPVVGVVSTKRCPVLEGDQRDSAIELVTLLVESCIRVPVNFSIVEHLESLPSSKEISGQHIKGECTALDLLPLKLD